MARMRALVNCGESRFSFRWLTAGLARNIWVRPAQNGAGQGGECNVELADFAIAEEARKTINQGAAVAEETKSESPVIIKKYANRRLYNTQTSSYVTLDHLAQMVKEGTEFEVRDARTGEDITRSVLTQIIFEEEAKGQNLLADPVPAPADPLLWRQSAGLRAGLSRYVDGKLHQEPGSHAGRIAEAFGGGNQTLENITRQNLAMFERAMKMFSPFGMPGTARTSEDQDARQRQRRGRASQSLRRNRRTQKRDRSDAPAACGTGAAAEIMAA